jgi:PAS domain S-box-containing protein
MQNSTVGGVLPVRSILLVEDNYDDFDLLEFQLASFKDAGLSLTHSECLAAALLELTHGDIELILLDLSLPDSTGLDTVKKIRQAAPLIPLIVLTGTEDDTTALQALAAGAQDYLIKGRIDLPTLHRSISYAVARKSVGEANARLAAIVESSNDAIIGKTISGRITSWNRGAEMLFGYSSEEAVGQSIAMLIPSEELEEFSKILTKLQQGEVIRQETVRIKKDGQRVEISQTISPIETSGTISGASEIARDMTEHNQKERERKHTKDRLALALNSAEIGVWDLDLLQNTVWRSIRHDEIYGHDTPLAKWNFEILIGHVVQEGRQSVREAFKAGLETGHFRMQYQIIRPNDKAVRWISARGETFKDEFGEPIRIMGTVADITDIKQREEQLRLVAVMKEREDFMATLTHDMKNPLLGANRFLDLFIKGSVGEISDEQREMLQCLKESNHGLLKLIADLTDVYRMEKDVKGLSIETLSLPTLIASCVSRTIPFANLRSIKVSTQLPEKMGTLKGDASRLERVVQNLLDNAVKFVPDFGTINVRLTNSQTDSVIEIEDDGPGIAPEEQSLLFKRFSQGNAGKRYAGGSGLGLYLCKQIINAHGGTIECQSQPKTTTVFRVWLPKENDRETPLTIEP